MPVLSRNTEAGTSYVVTKFLPISSIQSYLVAFTVSTFTYVEDNIGEVPQKVYAKPQSISNGDADYALGVSRPILEAFATYLGVNYDLPKMDQAALPDFAAG